MESGLFFPRGGTCFLTKGMMGDLFLPPVPLFDLASAALPEVTGVLVLRIFGEGVLTLGLADGHFSFATLVKDLFRFFPLLRLGGLDRCF